MHVAARPARSYVRAMSTCLPARAARVALPTAAALLLFGACASRLRRETADPDRLEWISLFNGRNLEGWVPKFAGYPLGQNLHETFRVEEGLLKVRYDRWAAFGGEFGHLFHRRPFSHYVVGVEYRFVGQQVAGAGPALAWAIRNNGVMLHSQSPESMGLRQDFPISLEAQLLGGTGAPRTTANLCTPGTHVMMHDTLVTQHCINSRSATFAGDQWVRMEALVLGDSVIRHIVNGDTVLTYTRPRMGGGMANNALPGVLQDGKPLTGGYIALQAETAPIDFRKVEVLNLEGCRDSLALNFKRYFVKSNPAACMYAATGR